jgi:hypothetical protein
MFNSSDRDDRDTCSFDARDSSDTSGGRDMEASAASVSALDRMSPRRVVESLALKSWGRGRSESELGLISD